LAPSSRADALRAHLPKDPALPPKARFRREHDWNAIRRDYEAGELTVETICAAHAISEWTLYDERARAGWSLRCPRRPPPVNSSKTELSARFVNALDEKMRRFEKRLQDTAGSDSSVDSDRDARTLSTLVRLFEKLTTLHGVKAALAGKTVRQPEPLNTDPDTPDTAPSEDTHDQERLRGELARRLDVLRAQLGG
jgi:hypothetical protein